MHTLRRVTITVLAIAVLITTSCTVREELMLDGSGSGSATLTINLNPILLSYYNDLLTAMTGVEGDYPVFDLEQLALAFAARPSLNLTEIERSALGQLRMEFTFDDLNKVLAEADGAVTAGGADGPSDVFSFRSVGSRRELTVRLDRSAVNAFMGFAPPESAMMTEFLLPPEDGSVSRSEYQDELAWALEEYAPADEVRRVLEQSAIEVVVRPSGRIESQSGGIVRDGAVIFRVPILELLTLSEERVYRVVFVP
ncbi:MAG: hypothetical protein KAU31_03750 [Spirochaetaceae bacterium]|nr:hypothetical protein [Spirochaetaceae bacterium]